MPVQVSYPGVYIQEMPPDVHTIVGLATSATAFVDVFKRGPVGEPVRIDSFSDFNRTFGGVWDASEASYAISQYFLNGGETAWVLRLEPLAAKTASAKVIASGGVLTGYVVVELSATDPGAWGNKIEFARFEPNKPTLDADGNVISFGLSIREVAMRNGKEKPVQSELFHDLTFGNGPRDVVAVLEHESVLVRAKKTWCEKADDVATALGVDGKDAAALKDLLGGDVFKKDGLLYSVWPPAASPAESGGVAPRVSSEVESMAHNHLSGGSDGVSLEERKVARARLEEDHAKQVAAYEAYVKAAKAGKEPSVAVEQPDDLQPFSSELADELALIMTDVDRGFARLKTMAPARFNLLCLPATFKMSLDNRKDVHVKAHEFCEAERAFYILDAAPHPTPEQFRNERGSDGNVFDYSGELGANAAVYFPHVTIPDPLRGNRPRAVGPSGTVAGVIARTDTARGIWKAPAGTSATIRGATPGVKVTDAQNGVLNELGINVLRTFPVYGSVIWGARTTDGADFEASQWKYLPVRRLTLHIENSLFEGSKWVVFEPNDEPLWSQIRLSIGTFMHDLFRQGAFQGATPAEAYFVRCDKTTTTQSDIDKGIVNIVVGFAPLKPAEFVIISIQQIHPD